MPIDQARVVHGVVASVAAFSLVWQLVLVVQGSAVLDETLIPPLGARVVNYFSFFTIESNLLVLGTSCALAVNPAREGMTWRVLRMNAIVGITVTGVVHWFLLRPTLHLSGASFVVDKLLHVVIPLLTVLAWVAAGPREKLDGMVVVGNLVWPAVWAAYTLVRGAITAWYPYPFIDAGTLGYPRTLVNIAGIAVLLTVVALLVVGAERMLARRPVASH